MVENAKDKSMKLVDRVYSDLKYSVSKMSELHKSMKEDVEFAQGKQWDECDIATLKNRGVKALTINKIKPIIKLLTGIERQSRSDYKILPEGGEDVITAEIANRLVKNIVKNSRLQDKLSAVYKSGNQVGMSFIEPYVDYTFDLINGDLQFKKINGQNIYLDPSFQEYDLSDSRFVIKVSKELEYDDLLALFPNDKKKIDNIAEGTINIDNLTTETSIASPRNSDYDSNEGYTDDSTRAEKKTYDLIDYYYKDYQTRYYVFIETEELTKEFISKEKAEAFAEKVADSDPVILDRKVQVIMLAQVVGDTELYNDVAPTYPKWKTYPIIPFFAELITDDITDMNLRIQGVVRGIKDLNLEFNKRRTQELNHLNSSANSGFDIEKGALDAEELANLKKNGSAPGLVVQRKKGYAPISRISPMPLSQGHAQLAAENAMDLKEASGVNPDLLANDSKSQSGRAILLKQRQGLVMLQESLDNYAITKNMIGKYIVSQLSELMTVKSATKIIGRAYIADNFTTPVNIVLERALNKVQAGEQLTELEKGISLEYSEQDPKQPILDGEPPASGMPDNRGLKTIIDTDTANLVIEKVISDSEMGKYDVAISEGPFSETIALANFTDLKELATQGVPIPPQDLISESMLPDAKKKRIIANLAAMSQAAPTEKA